MTPGGDAQRASMTHGGTHMTVEELITQIQAEDDAVRGAAVCASATAGASAIPSLAAVAATAPQEAARSACRAMWAIVRHCGRPGAGEERKAVAAALAGLLVEATPEQQRRDVLAMLAEVGGEEEIAPIAALLGNEALREDARITLERIPLKPAKKALREALDAATGEFKNALAESLRHRGDKLAGIPSLKMTPTKSTSVQAL